MIEFLKTNIIESDILSDKPEIRTDEKNVRFKTIYGGVLTILSTLLIVAASISFGIDLIRRKNSSVTYNLLPADDSTQAQIGDFPFMVALLDNGLKLLEDEDRYYTFYSEVWNFIPNNSTGNIVMDLKREVINTERCDINKHFGKYKDLFKDVPYLNHHYCLIPGQNISVYGLYGSTKKNNFVDHWISICLNDTSLNRTNCHPQEKSRARLVNTYISFVFLDYSIDHNDFNNPVKILLRSEILPVSSTIYKRIFFYQRPVKYTTDYGLILEDNKDFSFYQVLDSKENVDLRPSGTVPGSFALISVLMDKYNNFYMRKYSKIQNFLADIGGLIKGLILISAFLNYLISYEFFFVDLVNSLYKVEIVKSNDNTLNRDKLNIIESNKNIIVNSNTKKHNINDLMFRYSLFNVLLNNNIENFITSTQIRNLEIKFKMLM